ncbi:MAG: hypothetical protein EAZ92_13365 [Candidatus Kapaibacterium sp.]|nr:MAG: hypothetical protein EAZ92_13365 [Candidatus Kapabacteria bacterium]
MKRLFRPPAPDFLLHNTEAWGKDFAAKRTADPPYTLQWRQINGKKVNVILRELLAEKMTQHHCSYCDGGYRLGASAQATLDHFRPKSVVPLEVYEWENLFVCCNVCQEKKLEQFEEALLKPDAEDFDTFRYFVLNFETGEIGINPRATTSDKARAETSIRIFGLNDSPRPQMRLTEFTKWQNTLEAAKNLDDFNYRFFLEL